MAFTRILQWLGNTLVLLAALMVLTALMGLFLLELQSATVMSVTAVVTGLLGGVMVLSTQGSPARETNFDALLFLILFWSIVPAIGALPYLTLGATDSLVVAWFESVSAFTTTGASTLVPEAMPRSLLIWRSLYQWLGGVTVATFAVVILASLNLAGTGVHRSMLFTLRKGELFGRLIGIGRVIAGLYTLIASIGFMAMSVAGTAPFDAFCLALSGTATGGLAPRSGPLADYLSPTAAVSLAVICLLGAASIAAHWDLFRLRTLREIRHWARNVEHRALVSLTVALLVLGFAFTGFRHFWTVSLEAAYLASSAGYDYTVIGLELLPPAVLIAVALIGGSALSTAGGLKLVRLLLLFRHVRTDLERLTHPSRVKPVIFRHQVLPDTAFLSVWMYFLGYTLVLGAGTVALGTLGLPYDVAVPASAGSLSNVGPLLEANMVLQGWADFSPAQLSVSAVLMLVGRVEVLAVLAIFSPRLWIR